MFRAVKIKISDQQLIEELEFLHSIFKTEYDLVRREVSLTSFNEKEYSHAHRGRFTEKLAVLTNKRYLSFPYVCTTVATGFLLVEIPI